MDATDIALPGDLPLQTLKQADEAFREICTLLGEMSKTQRTAIDLNKRAAIAIASWFARGGGDRFTEAGRGALAEIARATGYTRARISQLRKAGQVWRHQLACRQDDSLKERDVTAFGAAADVKRFYKLPEPPCTLKAAAPLAKLLDTPADLHDAWQAAEAQAQADGSPRVKAKHTVAAVAPYLKPKIDWPMVVRDLERLIRHVEAGGGDSKFDDAAIDLLSLARSRA